MYFPQLPLGGALFASVIHSQDSSYKRVWQLHVGAHRRAGAHAGGLSHPHFRVRCYSSDLEYPGTNERSWVLAPPFSFPLWLPWHKQLCSPHSPSPRVPCRKSKQPCNETSNTVSPIGLSSFELVFLRDFVTVMGS